MFTSYLFLAIAALLPVAAAIIFFFLNKTGFNKLPYLVKQAIYGIVFGGLAVVGTHWSIPFDGAAANARDAAVIIGGLIFGGPTGIIAGTIGGLERMIVGIVNYQKFGFTAIACSVSTFLAGVIAAIVRHFAFDDKRPRFLSGFFTGFVIEVFHLLMVFVTNAAQYQKAFTVVQACTPPMLTANSFAVLIALIVYAALDEGKKAFRKPDTKTLNSKFIVTLSGLTFIAFILSSTFVFLFNNTMSNKQVDNDLAYAINETASEIDQQTIEKAKEIAVILNRNKAEWYVGDESGGLVAFCIKENIAEVNIIDAEGYIRYSNEDLYVNGTAHGQT